jgi:phosphotriesterase-related protein
MVNMAAPPLSGKVQTVLGPIEPTALGVTMTHEHLLITLGCVFRELTEASDRGRAHQPITLENLGWVRQNWMSSWSNLFLDDEELAVKEALLYKLAGGNTIVDMTNNGLGRDPLALARIARATGLNIVMGSGYYVAASHPPDFARKTEEQITQEIVKDIMEGVGNTGVKSGIIGEIGTSWPITDNEKKSLRAAIEAQKQTGACLSIHLGRHPQVPFQVLEILRERSADLQRTVFCHMDRTIEDRAALRELAQSGVTLEYDLFGMEVSYLPGSHFAMPSDAQRLQRLEGVIQDGFINQTVVSQDVCIKIRLAHYGGTGYAHIVRYVVPWMRQRGWSDGHIKAVLVENPRRLLTFA